MLQPLELLERIESDLAALKAYILPPTRARTIADQIREFVAEAKQEGKDRSWVVDRCESELNMPRAYAWRRLHDIWPTNNRLIGQRGKWTKQADGEEVANVHENCTVRDEKGTPISYHWQPDDPATLSRKRFLEFAAIIDKNRMVVLGDDIYEVKNFSHENGIRFDFVDPPIRRYPKVGRGIATHAPHQRILTVRKPNPKWKGYRSYERYELYRVGQTVAEFLAAGGWRKDLHYDTKKGYITLSD